VGSGDVMAAHESDRTPPPALLEKVQPVRPFVEAFRGLFRRWGSQKAAAITLGISEQQFSTQLRYDGEQYREHLSLWKLSQMPPEFWADVVELLVEFYGLGSQWAKRSRDDDAAELARAVRDLLKSQGR